MEKIYCQGCKHLRTASSVSYPYDICVAPNTVKQVDTYLHISLEYPQCRTKNAHNDCKDFEK